MHSDEERLTLSNRIHMVLGGTEIRGIFRYFMNPTTAGENWEAYDCEPRQNWKSQQIKVGQQTKEREEARSPSPTRWRRSYRVGHQFYRTITLTGSQNLIASFYDRAESKIRKGDTLTRTRITRRQNHSLFD